MDTNKLWETIKQNLQSSDVIPSSVYNRYIEPAKLVETNSGEFFLIVRFKVAKDIVVDNLELIYQVIRQETGQNINFNILTDEEWKNQQQNFPKPLKKDNIFNFKHFVVGASNREAFNAAKTVCNKLGTVFNPLFIYANSGLGKTHLLKAINQEIENQYPKTKVLYLTSERFGNEVVEVIQKGFEEIENFKEKIRSFNVLLIDDIQFLAKREKTNEIFFSIFNDFVENNKQIVITSDKSPEQLNGFDQRMITRFNSGLIVKIDVPDLDTAISIIENELKCQEIKMSKEAISYLATYFANDVRKIKGTINRILFMNMNYENNNSFSLYDIIEIFKDVPTSSLGKLNTAKIKEIVAQNYGISVKLIDGKTRTAEVVTARHVAMYLTKEILNKPLTQIGVDFGGKDHTTVINALNKIQNRLEKDHDFSKVLSKIKGSIINK